MIPWAFIGGVAASAFAMYFPRNSKKAHETCKSRVKNTKGSSKPWLREHIWVSPLCPMESLMGIFLFQSWDPHRLLALVSPGIQTLFSRKITPLVFQEICHHHRVWEVLLTALGGEAAHWVSPVECEWCIVIGVMASMGNDLKNSSNEIPCRSLERPASTNAL